MALHTGEAVYNRWALELAQAAHTAFTFSPPGSSRKRMVWKMSIDLSRSLVPSMGHHDPLDGLTVYLQTEATASLIGRPAGSPDLSHEIQRYHSYDAVLGRAI